MRERPTSRLSTSGRIGTDCYSRTVNRVLVLGVPRSGTTWVGEALGRTSGSSYVHEPDGTSDPFSFRAKFSQHFDPILDPRDEAPDLERLWQGAFAGGARPNSVRGRIARRAFRRVTSEQKRAALLHGHFTPRLRIAYSMAMPRVATDADNVVVKSVNAALCAEWITTRWDPRVVVVSRDPRNVLSSWLSLGWNGPDPVHYRALGDIAEQRWGAKAPPPDAPTLARAAATVATLSLALRDALRRNDDWLQVTHEALCADPVPRLVQLAAALGLTWSPEAEAYVVESDRPGVGYRTERVASEQADRWQERLSPEQLALIDSVLAQFPAPLSDPLTSV